MSDDHERSSVTEQQRAAVSDLIEKAYSLMSEDRDEEANEVWAEVAVEIWPVIDGVIASLGMDGKPTEDKVDRSYEKDYDLNDVLADADVALADAKKYEERLAFNRRLLDTFDMTSERNQYFSARQAIAESLNGLGRYEECDAGLKRWKYENETEVYPDFVWLRCARDRKQNPEELKALADSYMAKEKIDAPHEDVMMLYEMIALIYADLGEEKLRKEAEARMNA